MIPGMFAAGAVRGGEPAPGGDPYWDNVAALWQLDGNDVPRDLKQDVDLLITGTVSAVTDYGTPWGPGKSIFTDQGSYVFRNDGVYRFTTGDFTMEAWAYLIDSSTTLTGIFAINGPQNSHVRHGLRNTPSGNVSYYNSTKSPNFELEGGAANADQWHHVAVARQGDTIRIFLDGQLQDSIGITGSIETQGTYWGVTAGYARISGNNYGPVAIHSCRLTHGVARYTSDFTPPHAPFPAS